MNRFHYSVRILLVLGILAVVIAGFTGTEPVNNPFSNIPTIVTGVLMILLAIALSIMGKREQLEEYDQSFSSNRVSSFDDTDT
jgi:Mn2+/Fe2+ NRAMP family transporter